MALLLLAGCNTHQKSVTQAPIDPTAIAAPAVTFTDVTEKAGIRFRHVSGAIGNKWLPETMGGGGGFLDYDNDGWLDILLINSDYWPNATSTSASSSKRPTPALYRNNRNGTFTDVTKQVGLNIALYGMGLAVGDYDNDGFEDVLITAIPRSRLFHNVPDGRGGRRFVDVTEKSGLRDTGWPTSAAWLDYNRDGNLDLFVCHYVEWSPGLDNQHFYSVDGINKSYARPQSYHSEPCRMYHNLGKGKFQDVSKELGLLNTPGKSLGVAVCDYDNDALPDIFVANDTEPNFLFHNQGGAFQEIGQAVGIALSGEGKARAGMGIDTADVMREGMFDVLITNFSGEQLTLYRRDSTGLYLDVAARSGVGIATQTYLGFGAFFFDYDLDGWMDIFVTNGHIHDDIERRDVGVTYAEPSLLFRNLGEGRFADVSVASGWPLTIRRVGRAAAWGDFDNNGTPDVLIMTNNGSPALLRNDNKTGNGWIRIQLKGTVSNRNAIGARVRVTVGGSTLTQDVKSGSSYLSASDRRLLFGLGSAPKADRVEIRWPSGKVQPYGPIQRGQTIQITEGR
jgi:hypothetical protein